MTASHFFRIMAFISTIAISPYAYALEESDPLEGLNRKTYSFNKMIDGLYIKPVAKVYEKALPLPVKASVGNVIRNLAEVPVAVNGILQGKVRQAFSDVVRFGINFTLGIFGLFDVATQMGISAHKEDFGKTLYAWGWKDSSYFVIPILGPSTIRDTLGIFGNTWMSVPTYFKPTLRNQYSLVTLVDKRRDFNETENVAGIAGVEYYNLLRSSYFQHRQYEFNGATQKDGADSPSLVELQGPPA